MPDGFSLLEVLITLFLISVGLLGFADAELNAMRELQLLQQYRFLTQQLSSLDEQLQMTSEKNTVLNSWQQQLKVIFPQAEIVITPTSSGYRVRMQWQQQTKKYHLEEMLYE